MMIARLGFIVCIIVVINDDKFPPFFFRFVFSRFAAPFLDDFNDLRGYFRSSIFAVVVATVLGVLDSQPVKHFIVLGVFVPDASAYRELHAFTDVQVSSGADFVLHFVSSYHQYSRVNIPSATHDGQRLLSRQVVSEESIL